MFLIKKLIFPTDPLMATRLWCFTTLETIPLHPSFPH